jgi:hypothetical protein
MYEKAPDFKISLRKGEAPLCRVQNEKISKSGNPGKGDIGLFDHKFALSHKIIVRVNFQLIRPAGIFRTLVVEIG